MVVVLTIPKTIILSLKWCTNDGFISFIVDTTFGGTYVTLMYTITNFGRDWIGLLLYPAVDLLSITINEQVIPGYAILACVSAFLGIVLIFVLNEHFKPLQEIHTERWTVPSARKRI